MSRIELNHWYVRNNELSISLISFYTRIEILENNQTIYYRLYVKGNDNKELTFNFYTIEDAISFTEQIIAKSHDINEVLEKYIIKFENEKLNNSYSNQSNNNTSAINLTPEEVDQAIVDYFEEIKDYRVSVKEELSLHQDKLDLKFYLIEHLDHDKIEKKLLTEEDLKNALNNYISFYNYKLLDFKYIGGIHRTGYYFDKDTPHYDGIKLIVKTKNKEKSLIKKPIN